MSKITQLPTPPSTEDDKSFEVKADAFLEDLPSFREEMNALIFSFNELGNFIEDELAKPKHKRS